MYPNDEFLPRAPDPEEIIFGDDEPPGSGDGNVALNDDPKPEEDLSQLDNLHVDDDEHEVVVEK